MGELYVNFEDDKSQVSFRPSTPHTGPSSSQSRSHGAVVLSLGLLSVFLLAGLVGLGVHYHNSVRGSAADLSTIKANLTERLRATEANLTERLRATEANLTERLRATEDNLTERLRATEGNLTERLRATEDNLTERLRATEGNLTERLRATEANLTERLRATEDNLTERLRATEANLTERLRATEDNLTERLRATEDKLTSVSEERDLLKSSLTQLTEEMDRLQRLSNQKKTCPAGWKMFRSSCYLLSTRSDSWEKSREDCRDRGADLVIIDSLEEQKFLTSIIKHNTWIGLNDRDDEGTWKWVDGTPLTQAYWSVEPDNGGVQPDNGGGVPEWGEEDCVEMRIDWKAEGNWNDLRCNYLLYWTCEKLA